MYCYIYNLKKELVRIVARAQTTSHTQKKTTTTDLGGCYKLMLPPTNRSTSLSNAFKAVLSSLLLLASDAAFFTAPATTVLFAPLTTGLGTGASVVTVGIMDAAPSANASIALVTASRSRFSLRLARRSFAVPSASSIDDKEDDPPSPRRSFDTKSSAASPPLDVVANACTFRVAC